jgi:LPS-assembly protein
MGFRRDRCSVLSQRPRQAVLAAILVALAGLAAPAQAQSLLPAGFFDRVPATGGQAQIEADILAYDGNLDLISAEGGVLMYYEGYELRANRLTYNQATNALLAEGNVQLRDPSGTHIRTERIEVTGGMKEAFIESLTLTTEDGSLIRARDVHHTRELVTILTEAHYSPCGLCIDEKGRRIGWKVNASKITYDRDNGIVYLEGPTLEVLGIPVAWAPWLAVPDPSQPRRQGFRMPSVDYDEKYGGRLDLPYFLPIGEDMDLLLTPTLLSRQGALMGAEFTHRVPLGEYVVRASGVYQLDPGAFSFIDAQRDWRGAFQTTGTFEPVENWTAGWSYTAFTDAAYLIDYKLRTSKDVINEVYATYLTQDTYLDLRAQQFNLLGDVLPQQQDEHARAIPNIRAASYNDLGEFGRIDLSARVLGIQRGADSTATYGGVPYVFAYEENKLHATVEAAWQNRYILPVGVVATPYLGLRADAVHYDGISSLPGAPPEQYLLEATPIAAVDFRWPLMATSGFDTHLLEPIVQLVYRGSSNTLPGITNDDAQSFVFDDTNLFSYNRFSGYDRQETGLRVNIGGRYLANFEDGGWLELIGGQSYHLAGVNALGVVDTAQTGNSTGLDSTASYVVLGARGAPFDGLTLGAKAQIDPGSMTVRRGVAAAGVSFDDYTLGADYTYVPANAATGVLADQHEVTGRVAAPLPFDYWSATASLSWDLAANTWLEATAGITYDDGYFVATGFGTVTGPTHSSPDNTTFGFSFKLRGPIGEFSL